jgi:N-acetylglucosamine malate deacetylase 1
MNRDVDTKNEELSLLVRSDQQAGKIFGAASVKLLGLPGNRVDSLDRLDVVKGAEAEIEQLQPHTVIIHHSGDVNIDHQITHEAVVTACRPQPGHAVRCLLAFEVSSSTEWQLLSSNVAFQPNWFEDVSGTIDRKTETFKVYKAEMQEWPHARSLQNVKHLTQWQGGSVGCEAVETFIMLRELK